MKNYIKEKAIKWFKHYSDSLDDSWIQELMDEFSHFGYAGWFGIISLICRENKNNLTGKASFTPAFLRRKLRSSPTRLRQLFDYCQTNGRLLFNKTKKKWEFELPKILEIKDNYTKDLQATGKKPSKHKEKEEEKEEEKELSTCVGSAKKPLPTEAVAALKLKINFDYEIGKFKNITDAHRTQWSQSYPAVDVLSELQRMESWAAANPKNRKSNWQRFIVNWLVKAQDRAKPITRQSSETEKELWLKENG